MSYSEQNLSAFAQSWKFKHALILIIALFSSFTFISNLNSQSSDAPEPVVIGEKGEIQSKILKESRPLMIYKPDGYDDGQEAYPVIYLLDGGGNFHHTTACVRFLSKNGRIPEMLVIGIPNTSDRTHDLTPKIFRDISGNFPTAGGADDFLQFISEELIPYVDKNYRTQPYKLLIGHSFGGLFVTHTILNQPQTFDAYISISPSLWWDDQYLVGQSEKFWKNNEDLKGHLYMTMGGEGGKMFGGAMKFAAILEESAPESFQWQFKHMPEETHGSIPHRSTYNGLETIFEDWNLQKHRDLFVAGGLPAIDAHIGKLKERFGFAPSASEQAMNGLGYMLLVQKRIEDAIAIFKRNTETFPKSSNVWDSLGEGYKENGEKQKAIKNYRKSLELNPGNDNAKKMLIELGIDSGEFDKKIRISKKMLASYAGKYEVNSDLMVQIFHEGDQLFGQATGTPKVELFPMSEIKFYLKVDDVQVTFIKDKAGKVSGLKLKAGGDLMKAKKVE
ncbi:MAG: DUF3471 domain-containing protein [Bacteroidetes bacterium]|nr:DUF3471 domain-containing protein [Bacteroidota bacterium]